MPSGTYTYSSTYTTSDYDCNSTQAVKDLKEVWYSTKIETLSKLYGIEIETKEERSKRKLEALLEWKTWDHVEGKGR